MENDYYNINERDKVIASAVAFHLVIMACKNCLVSTSAFFNSFNTALNIICMLLIFGNYARIIFFKNSLNRLPLPVILTLSFLFIFCTITQLKNPDLLTSSYFPYNYVKETFVMFLSYSVPCFIFCSVLKNPVSLLLALYKYAWVMFIVAISSFILYILGHSSSYEYSGSFSKNMVLFVFVFLFLFYERKKICYIVVSILLCFIMVICGSRSPLIPIAVLILIYLYSLKGSIKFTIIKSMFAVAIILTITMLNTITSLFVDLLGSCGIESRTLRMLSTGMITYDSGRSVYFEKIFDALNNSPLLGLGAFGGSVQVGLTHNLYIDIWANFGYFAGTALMLFILFNLIKIFRVNQNYSLTILFFSVIVFPRGFTGFDFWATKELWILFGLMVSYYSRSQSTRSYVYRIENENKQI